MRKDWMLLTLMLMLCVLGTMAEEAGLYDEKTDIVKLTQANFDTLVTKSDDVWVIEFYGKLLHYDHSALVWPLQSVCERLQKTGQRLQGRREVRCRGYDG